MKVLLYNMQAGCGGSRSHFTFWNYFRANPETLNQIADKMKKLNPDIIGLVEVDAGSFRTQNQVKFLAEKLNYDYASTCKYGWPAGLPVLKHQHLAILTKHKILTVKHHKFLVGFKKLVLEVVVHAGKEAVSIIVTHLSLGTKTRRVQIKGLENIIKTTKHKVILMGDFNQESLAVASLKNCCKAKTFPAWKPARQLDYIFTNAKVKSAAALDWQLSDHLPVYAEIEI